MRRSRWSRTIVVLVLVASMVALVGAGSALAQPPERVKVLIGFTQQPGPAEQALVHRAGGRIKYTYHLVPAIAASIPEAAIDGLRRNPNVTSVDLDLEVYAVDEVLPWGIDRIDAEVVHLGGNTGAGVRVAVIDTGIDYTHPDLDGNYAGGYDFVNTDEDPMDDAGHGTHVAGTIAAEDNDAGVVGVAPEAELYALKVLDKTGSGYYSDVIAAIQWSVDYDMQVINMSLGGGFRDRSLQKACDNAYKNGVLLVAAAGNEASGRILYPAKYASVIAVSATDQSDGLASFSNYGREIELAAPGVDILSTYKGGDYATGDGTSMASPHVAGTAALVMVAYPSWTNAQVRTQLQDTADDLGAAGQDDLYGYGLVDADGAAPAPTGPQPPVANAGVDQTVSDGDGDGFETVTLDGSGSSDPDGTVVSYEWKEGNTVLSTDPIISKSFDVADSPHTVILTVTDDDGATDTDDVIITVNANQPPTANAGPDQTALVGEVVTFDGSGSYDIDGDIVSYDWDFGDDSTGSGVTASHAYGTAGTYTVVLTVTDNGGLTDADTAIVTVTEEPAYAAMHIARIDMSLKIAGPNRTAIATVTIVDADVDADGNPVEGATVSGQWSGLTSDSDSGVTDASGKVALSSDRVRNASGTFTFTVTDVTREDGWTYNPDANVETSDSIIVD